ncbi:MAG: hypothetical protein JO040_08585 [Gemmatimonadetes bacterium]|nr:hypothetical protein [Gemmatimonadota bacterium]
MRAMEGALLRQWIMDSIREDYRRHLGRVLRVSFLLAYNTRYGDHEQIHLAHPARVRVIETPPHRLEREARPGHVDPLWAVELVDSHLELLDAADLVLWVPARGYDARTGEAEPFPPDLFAEEENESGDRESPLS